jgi:UDP-glucose 4-epimerase
VTQDNNTVLVTGGAGFIGSHLADRLLDAGRNVIAVDNLSSGKRENLRSPAQLEQMDIRDPKIKDLIADTRPGTVFHAAAQISVSVSAREPALDADINVMGTLNLLDAVRLAPGSPAKFVFVSTGGAMYGEPEDLPASESLPAMPGSPYGASKHTVEVYLPVYKRLFGVQYSILRLANVYGPRQDPHGEAGVVAIFTRAMLAGKEVTIFGDGKDERDYVFVGDVADALVAAAGGHGEGPYNVGTGIGANVNDLFAKLGELCGYTRAANYGPPRAGDIHKISLSYKKIASDLGWAPQTDLIDGLARTVAWFRQH